jgi:hypothetical protein
MRAAVLLVPLLLIVGGCAPDRDEWVGKNEALLARLPHYPGSERVATQTLEIEEGNELSPRVVGYSTHVSYRPPPTASARAVVRFFAVRLRREGWTGRTAVVDRVPAACFSRGRAFVSILTDGMVDTPAAERTFEVGVNHDGGAPAVYC